MRRHIACKRDGRELAATAWHEIVAAYMRDEVDDAQMAALAMACIWRGMTLDEAAALTDAMVRSGRQLRFDDPRVVDKHSSGGVSDIVSLVAVPLAASCGARVAKLSGRALGHTGGTIDKLETIPGFEVNLSPERFVEQVRTVGCAIAAQSAEFVPADRRIYALRDRTATVPAPGLIAASIVSKKIAGGASSFVFDVKCGRGSFMATPHDAGELARWLVGIASRFDRRATALVTDMNQPLGHAVGTGLEVIEACDFLKRGSDAHDKRVFGVVTNVVEAMLAHAGITDAQARIADALRSGAAYEKFVELVQAQGSTRAALEAMAASEPVTVVPSPLSGYVASMDVVALGHAGRALATRDPLAGITVSVRIGDRVDAGAALARIHGAATPGEVRDLGAHFELRDEPVEPPPLVYAKVSS